MRIKLIERGIIILEIILLFLFVYFHLKLGLVRYFDADEFAHLHWAYNFFSGMKPYQNFLYFFPPGFLILLWPLWFILGKSYTILTAGRVLAFGFFLVLLGAVWLLAREIGENKTDKSDKTNKPNGGYRKALLTTLILAFLPLPFDKMIEIRPDTVAVVLAIVGMWALIRGIIAGSSTRGEPLRVTFGVSSGGYFFLSGLFYGLSLVVLPKMVFYALSAVIILGIYAIFRRVQLPHTGRAPLGHSRCVPVSEVLKPIFFILSGSAVPLVFTLLFFLWSGNFSRAFYLTTKFASKSTDVLGHKFYMHASHFFHPNDTYYGYGGISIPLIINLVIYLIGIIWGIKWMISFLEGDSKEDILVKLFVPLTFLLNLFAFIKIYPLKHAQYIITFAPFVAFFCADFLFVLKDKFKGKISGILSNILFIGVIGGIGVIGVKMNNVKINWIDWRTRYNTQKISEIIPKNEYVLDMVGETLFYKDPYYICCIPYGQYLEAFDFTLPSLERVLESTGTKYIYLNNEGRLGVLPPLEQKYLRNNFKVVSQDPYILRRK